MIHRSISGGARDLVSPVGGAYDIEGPWPASSSDNRSFSGVKFFSVQISSALRHLTLLHNVSNPGVTDPPGPLNYQELSALWCWCYKTSLHQFPGPRSACLGASPSHTTTLSAHSPTPRQHSVSCPRGAFVSENLPLSL